jgi:hypothetical protein
MDGNSPVVGPIVTVAHALLGEYVEGLLMPWDGKLSKESNWPNEDNGWMNDVFTKFIPDFDHERFNNWIAEVFASGDATQLLCAPLCTPQGNELAVPKQSCVVGDVLHVVPEKVTPPADQENTTDACSTVSPTASPQPVKPKPWANYKTAAPAPTTASAEPAKVEEVKGDSDVAKAVRVADSAVPMVGLKGKRASRPGVDTRVGAEAKSAKPSGKTLATKQKVKTDPRQWVEPKKGREESTADFTSRLAKWKTSRASVAKRLKIPL